MPGWQRLKMPKIPYLWRNIKEILWGRRGGPQFPMMFVQGLSDDLHTCGRWVAPNIKKKTHLLYNCGFLSSVLLRIFFETIFLRRK